MFNEGGFPDPRTKFSEWLIEKGKPFFNYLLDEFGIGPMTVIGCPLLVLIISSIIEDFRKGKKSMAIIEIIAAFFVLFAIIFGQITQSPKL